MISALINTTRLDHVIFTPKSTLENRPKIITTTRVMSLSVPHTQPLHAAATPGLFVEIVGKILNNDDYIVLNLASDRMLSDLPLHISLRVGHDKIVFNSRKNDHWQEEKDHKVKLKEGEHVTLAVVCEEKDFDIYVNGDKYYSLKYRHPLEDVRFINISGPIALESCVTTHKIDKIPHEENINNWSSIRIAGKTKHDFSVNLYDDNGDVMLHINPRFSKNQIVLNSKKGGDWQSEMLPGDFTFKKNDIFDIVINDANDELKLQFNYDHVTFAKRWLARIVNIEVNGEDLLLYCCQVTKGQEEPMRMGDDHFNIQFNPTPFGGGGRFGGQHGYVFGNH